MAPEPGIPKGFLEQWRSLGPSAVSATQRVFHAGRAHSTYQPKGWASLCTFAAKRPCGSRRHSTPVSPMPMFKRAADLPRRKRTSGVCTMLTLRRCNTRMHQRAMLVLCRRNGMLPHPLPSSSTTTAASLLSSSSVVAKVSSKSDPVARRFKPRGA